MKHLALAGLLGGLALLAALIAWQGWTAVAGVLANLGVGALWLPLAYLPHMLAAAASWRLLFPAARPLGFGISLRAMWAASAVDTLLPLGDLSTLALKYRMLTLHGAAARDTAASLVLEKTVQALSLVLWALIGIALLLSMQVEATLVGAALAGIAVLCLGIAGFVQVQRRGLFGLLRRGAGFAGIGRWAARFEQGAADLDAAVRALYDAPARLTGATAWRLAARMLLTLEVWLAAQLLGYPLGLAEALMLKSLSATLRGAAFFVPNGWGVQEGSYVALGALLGQPPEAMLALSLATRARELGLSLPGLWLWQRSERQARASASARDGTGGARGVETFRATETISARDVALTLGLPLLTLTAWLLPQRYWLRLCQALAPLATPMLGSDPARVERAIERLLGAAAPGVLRALAAESLLVILQLLRRVGPGGWHPTVRLRGTQHLEAARAEGRGVILWISAFLYADLIAKMGLHDAGLAVSHLSRRSHGFSGSRFALAVLNRLYQYPENRLLRERVLLDVHGNSGALAHLAARLAEGGMVSIKANDSAQRPVRVPFLRGELAMAPGALLLARRSGAPVLPVYPVREADGSFTVSFGQPLRVDADGATADALGRAAGAYAAELAGHVRAYPGQWSSWLRLASQQPAVD